MPYAPLIKKVWVQLSKSFVRAGKKSKFALLFVSSSLFVYYLLYFPLPTKKVPIRFYSTHQLDDFRLITLEGIKRAKHSIHVYTYALTDPTILSALVKKARSGLSVHVTYHQKNTPALETIKHLHLHPKKGPGLMHAKWIIIDETIVLLGTANLTTASLLMHENFLMGVYDQDFAQALIEPGYYSKKIGNQMLTFYLLPDVCALDALLTTLDQAIETVHIALFTFTHPLLIQKLIELHKRGVRVQITLDRSVALGASKKAVEALSHAGLTVRANRGTPLLHHKWALVDQSVLILGSANWTRAAFKKNKDFILFFSPLNEHQSNFLKKTLQLIHKNSFDISIPSEYSSP